MPLEWISPAGNDVTAAFADILSPDSRRWLYPPGGPSRTRLPGLASIAPGLPVMPASNLTPGQGNRLEAGSWMSKSHRP